MSQGRYVWIAGKKVYLNPELQKEWDKLINKERYRARQEKICGQADYRRCNGDCFVCPWRKEGIVVSYETEHFDPWFRKKRITLQGLTASDLQAFYMEQGKRVKPNTVIHYHAVIHRALKYAVKTDFNG